MFNQTREAKMSETSGKSALRRINWVTVILLALSSGTIYMMPFVRSTFYDALQQGLGVTNTQLGMIPGIYGLLTMLLYFPGGWLADRFSPKKLLVISFMANAVLGYWYSTLPSFPFVILIHVLFPFFCCMTFWAAFIKANRLCAPAEAQGRAFGIVEGIRRTFSVVLALTASWFFAQAADPVSGIKNVLFFYAAVNGVIGLGLIFFMKDYGVGEGEKTGATLADIAKVARIPEVWYIAFAVFLAYFSYRAQDVMTPYTTQLCGLSGTLAAVVASIRYYGLGIFAIPGGFLGDKIGPANTMIWGFVVIIITNILLIAVPASPVLSVAIFVVIITNIFKIAHFAMRGVYYALLTEGFVPAKATGIATGILATIAYSPDFFAPIFHGAMLDAYGKAQHTGYNIVFMASLVACLAGIVVCHLFKKRVKAKKAAGVTLEKWS